MKIVAGVLLASVLVLIWVINKDDMWSYLAMGP